MADCQRRVAALSHNLAAIVFASALTFLMLGFRATRADRAENARRGALMAVTGLVLVTVPLMAATLANIKKLNAQLHVATRLQANSMID